MMDSTESISGSAEFLSDRSTDQHEDSVCENEQRSSRQRQPEGGTASLRRRRNRRRKRRSPPESLSGSMESISEPTRQLINGSTETESESPSGSMESISEPIIQLIKGSTETESESPSGSMERISGPIRQLINGSTETESESPSGSMERISGQIRQLIDPYYSPYNNLTETEPESSSGSMERISEPTRQLIDPSHRPSSNRNGPVETELESFESDSEPVQFGRIPAPTESLSRSESRRGKRRRHKRGRSRRSMNPWGPTENEPNIRPKSEEDIFQINLETNSVNSETSSATTASAFEVPQIKINIHQVSIQLAILIKDYNVRIRGYYHAMTKYRNTIDIKDEFLQRNWIRLSELMAENESLLDLKEQFDKCSIQVAAAISCLKHNVSRVDSLMKSCFEITERINGIYSDDTVHELYLTEETRFHLGVLQEKMSLLKHRMGFAELQYNIYSQIRRFIVSICYKSETLSK